MKGISFKKEDSSLEVFTKDHGNGKLSVYTKIHIKVNAFEEDGFYFISNEDLDITGYGKDFKSANSHFSDSLEETLKFWIAEHTLESNLKELGFEVSEVQKSMPFFEAYFFVTNYYRRLADILTSLKKAGTGNKEVDFQFAF